jgi:hypothetical protein
MLSTILPSDPYLVDSTRFEVRNVKVLRLLLDDNRSRLRLVGRIGRRVSEDGATSPCRVPDVSDVRSSASGVTPPARAERWLGSCSLDGPSINPRYCGAGGEVSNLIVLRISVFTNGDVALHMPTRWPCVLRRGPSRACGAAAYAQPKYRCVSVIAFPRFS